MSTRRPTTGRARLRADHPATAWIVAGAVTVVAAMAMAMSFAGLAGVVGWTGLPGWASWTLPIALDGGMLAFTLSAFARRAEGRSTTWQWSMVVLATTASALANAAHVILPTLPGAQSAQVAVGAALSAFAPIWAALAAHQVADMVAPARPEPVRRLAVTSPTLASAAIPLATPAVPTAPARVQVTRPAPARPALDSSAKEQARREAQRLAGEGLSQRQIAEALAVSKSSVARWLTSAPQPEAVPV